MTQADALYRQMMHVHDRMTSQEPKISCMDFALLLYFVFECRRNFYLDNQFTCGKHVMDANPGMRETIDRLRDAGLLELVKDDGSPHLYFRLTCLCKPDSQVQNPHDIPHTDHEDSPGGTVTA